MYLVFYTLICVLLLIVLQSDWFKQFRSSIHAQYANLMEFASTKAAFLSIIS